MIPNAESDEETPTIVNVFLTLGLILTAFPEAETQLFFVGFTILLASIAVKFAFNYAASTKTKASDRVKHSLWVLMYHPWLGRPYRVIAKIRESETRAEHAGSLYCAALFYVVVLFFQLTLSS